MISIFFIIRRKCNPVEEDICTSENQEVCNDDFVTECPEIWEIQNGGARVWVPDTDKCVSLVRNIKSLSNDWNVFNVKFYFFLEKDKLWNCWGGKLWNKDCWKVHKWAIDWMQRNSHQNPKTSPKNQKVSCLRWWLQNWNWHQHRRRRLRNFLIIHL